MLEYFQTLADWYMQHMNYLSITLLMVIESSFIPFPSEIVIPPAIWKAAGGDLSMPLVVFFATLGAVIGAIVNYVLALWLGRVIVYKLVETRLGKLFMLSQHKVENAEVYFNRHGRSSTFIGRLVPGIRQLISIPAGLAKMNFKQFILFTALGSALWNIILAVLSYSLYTQQDMLKKYMSELSYALLAAGILFVVYLIWKYRKKKE
ncbi:MAG: DedA family protein [Prolixibacteraceae bacterium]|nr:DedA family protein [Prolixibacteraceae bacterium]